MSSSGGFGDPFGVAVPVESKEAEESAGDGAERDLGVRDGEAAGGLAGADVTQGAGCESTGGVEEVEGDAGDECGHFGVAPSKAAGDAQRGSEHLGWVVETGACGVDRFRPALEYLFRRGLEEFLLAGEVVVEDPKPISAASVISCMLARSPRPSAMSRTAASTSAWRVRAFW